MKGSIRRRGKSSWELKFDIGRDANGKRLIRYQTVRGKRQDAERELTKQLGAMHAGTLVDHSKTTVAEYLRGWLNTEPVLTHKGKLMAGKTLERYRQLAEQQIVPHLGTIALQKLLSDNIQNWHLTLLKTGGKGGKPLSPRTVGHAHRVLHATLARAARTNILARNVASDASPPAVDDKEIEILEAGQMADVLAKLSGHSLHTIVALALGSGMRRGELLGLQWGDVDLDGGKLRVERSVEETKAGLRFKAPKTKHGRRTISLPQSAVDALRAHRRKQLELRLALGLGREAGDTLVFSTTEGALLSPDNLSRDWRRAVKALGLPEVMFHALRHTHASALIASGKLDVVSISRRLGHGSPTVTLTVYAHMFQKTDTAAAAAIEAALTGGKS